MGSLRYCVSSEVLCDPSGNMQRAPEECWISKITKLYCWRNLEYTGTQESTEIILLLIYTSNSDIGNYASNSNSLLARWAVLTVLYLGAWVHSPEASCHWTAQIPNIKLTYPLKQVLILTSSWQTFLEMITLACRLHPQMAWETQAVVLTVWWYRMLLVTI